MTDGAHRRRLGHRGRWTTGLGRHGPENTHFDEMFEDILDGLEWLAARQERFRFDPAPVVVMGTSAGGHLSLRSRDWPARCFVRVCRWISG